jgi:mono/diheme cytochrome c family protein
MKMLLSPMAVAMIAALLAGPLPALAADEERGRLLYENHCTGCHESLIHIRETRKADSPAAIREQIERWRAVLDLDWQEDEVDDVLEYLNQRYYRYMVE